MQLVTSNQTHRHSERMPRLHDNGIADWDSQRRQEVWQLHAWARMGVWGYMCTGGRGNSKTGQLPIKSELIPPT